jgi:RHS repeat-associated protein
VSQTAPALSPRFAYTGREWDGEIGLYFYRARYYDPMIGRFIGEDPVGFMAGDRNLYRYVRNSPTNFTDPFGKIITIPASSHKDKCKRISPREKLKCEFGNCPDDAFDIASISDYINCLDRCYVTIKAPLDQCRELCRLTNPDIRL